MDVSFSADQLRRVLGSAEDGSCWRCWPRMAADGCGRRRRETVKASDHTQAQAIFTARSLTDEQAQTLLQKARWG